MSVTLRDYQEELVHKVRLSLRSGKRRPLVVAATGAGKTVVFSAIAQGAAEKGRNVLILAHRDALIKQASRKLRDTGLDHGIIMASYTPKPFARVQVGSVQTLVRRLKTMRWRPDIIIVDEAHLSAAKSYLAIINQFSNALVIGFTGSPCRLDNKPLGASAGGLYDDLVMAITIKQLIARGFLVRPSVFAPRTQLDLSGIKTSMGDYDQKALAESMDKPTLTGDAVDHYKRICGGLPAVAWCVSVAHAEHVAAAFRAEGITAEMLCGEHEPSERDAAMKRLETGETKVITFVGILIEGVDCPAISAIILLRPTLSLASYLQVIGRGLRPHTFPNGVVKDRCYVLDHAGLTRKHGFADDEREWSLDEVPGVKKKGKKKEEETVALKSCKKCFAVFAPAPVCPHCGEQVEVQSRQVEHVEGELIEVTPEMADQLRRDRRSEEAGAKTLEDLQKLAAQRGYSPGWAKHRFEARQKKRIKARADRVF